jgi:hypothetical protein
MIHYCASLPLAFNLALNCFLVALFLVSESSLFHVSVTLSPKEYFLVSVLAYWVARLPGSPACLVVILPGWSNLWNISPHSSPPTTNLCASVRSCFRRLSFKVWIPSSSHLSS